MSVITISRQFGAGGLATGRKRFDQPEDYHLAFNMGKLSFEYEAAITSNVAVAP